MLEHSEASYHSALFMVACFTAPPSVLVTPEDPQRSGASDICIRFLGPKGTVDMVWIIEIAVVTPVDTKMEQAKRYAESYGEQVTVLCCAISTGKPVSASISAKEASRKTAKEGAGLVKPMFVMAWEQRTKAGPAPVWRKLIS